MADAKFEADLSRASCVDHMSGVVRALPRSLVAAITRVIHDAFDSFRFFTRLCEKPRRVCANGGVLTPMLDEYCAKGLE